MLLVTGIYFGFLRDTDKPDTKPEAAKETVMVSAEPTSMPTPTPTPTPTPMPTPTPTLTPMMEERPAKEIVTYANGDVYKGEWKDGKRNGQGKMTYAHGYYVYEGEWKNGKFIG